MGLVNRGRSQSSIEWNFSVLSSSQHLKQLQMDSKGLSGLWKAVNYCHLLGDLWTTSWGSVSVLPPEGQLLVIPLCLWSSESMALWNHPIAMWPRVLKGESSLLVQRVKDQCCHGSGLDCCYGVGPIPGPGTSTWCGHDQKNFFWKLDSALVGKTVGKLVFSYTVDGNEKWYNSYGRNFCNI